MRTALERIKLIEKHLEGTLSSEEKVAFNEELRVNPNFKNEIEAQKRLLEGVKRAAFKTKSMKKLKLFKRKQKLWKWGLGGALTVLALAVAIPLMINRNDINTFVSHDEVAAPLVVDMRNPLVSKIINSQTDDSLFSDKGLVKKEYIDLTTIFKQLKKRPQSYTIDANRDTTIYGEEGTSIFIAANSIAYEANDAQVEGFVNIQLTEYYKTADLLKANLTTMSDSSILETGGMVNITADHQGKQCRVKTNSSIKIGFAAKRNKAGMQGFSGEWDNNKINWKELFYKSSDRNSRSEDSIEDVPMTWTKIMPIFDQGKSEMKEYMNEVMKLYRPFFKEKGGVVYVSFVVDKDGNTSSVNVIQPLGNIYDKIAHHIVSNFPKWTPGINNNRNTSVRYNLPVKFFREVSVLTANSELTTEQKQLKLVIDQVKVNSAVSGLNSSSQSEGDDKMALRFAASEYVVDASGVARHLFKSTRLGWINCDRFRRYQSVINFVVETDSSIGEFDVKMVFKDINSIIAGCRVGNKIIFSRIPEGKYVFLIGVKVVDSSLFIGTKETKTSPKVEQLAFRKIEIEDLSETFERFNKVE